MVEQAYLIDSHCHLHDQDFFAPEKQTELLQKAVENQVQKIVCIGTDHQDSLNAAGFVSQNPNYQLFWSYGIHPSECEKARPVVDFSKLEKTPIAIGEVGLDYHYGRDARDAQIKLLEEMLDLANRSHLPLIFHVREAFDDFFAILDNFSNQEIRGVVHSFTDNKKNLKKSLDRGFYIGVNGIATYSTLPMPPLDRILLETDAPFLAPVPFRGETNDPSHIKDIANWLAEKLNLSEAEIAKITSANTEALLGI